MIFWGYVTFREGNDPSSRAWSFTWVESAFLKLTASLHLKNGWLEDDLASFWVSTYFRCVLASVESVDGLLSRKGPIWSESAPFPLNRHNGREDSKAKTMIVVVQIRKKKIPSRTVFLQKSGFAKVGDDHGGLSKKYWYQMVYHGLPLSIQAVSYCVPLIVRVMLKMVTETWQGRAIHKLTTVVFQTAIYNPNNMYMYIKSQTYIPKIRPENTEMHTNPIYTYIFT